MSKNIPVANVLITAIGLRDTSFICQSINTMRSSNDNSRNPLKNSTIAKIVMRKMPI
ncbi:hypothetical protein H9W95_19865 [Flavobacterium lindanitolerans]|nr:hypothetical protein [Flavobacterium lindanitolerans]